MAELTTSPEISAQSEEALLPERPAELTDPPSIPERTAELTDPPSIPERTTELTDPPSIPERPVKLTDPPLIPERPVELTDPPLIPERPVELTDPPSIPERTVELADQTLIPVKLELSSFQEKSVLSKPPDKELSVDSPPISISDMSDIKLQCSLCHYTLQEPKLLPCLHTFCRIPCLERIVVNDNGRQSLTCPTCQCIVPLTDGGVARLQTDFHAENIIFKGEKTLKKNKQDCENCKKSSAVTYCQECKKFMCEKCQKTHRMWGDFREHKLLSLNDTSASNQFVDIPLVDKCEEHEKREAIIFCETCSELICGDCAAIQHKGHTYNLIDDIFPRHKEELATSMKPVQEMLEEIPKGLSLFDSRVKHINDQRATLEADIHRDIYQLQKILEQRKEELLTILDQSTQQKLTDLDAQRVEIEKRREKIGRCLDYATGCLQAEHKNEVLKLKAPILKQIEELKIIADLSVLQPGIEADVQYVTSNRASQACKEFGDIVCETNLIENSYVDLDAANFELVDNQSYQTVSHDSQKPSTRVEQKSSPTADIVCETNLIENSCVDLDAANFELVDNQSYQTVSHDSQEPPTRVEQKSSPTGLSRITTSWKSSVQHVQVVDRLHGPFGVAVNSQQQMIVVQNIKHRVLLMTSAGEKISSFGKQGSGKGQFNRASGVTVDDYDYIYVADNNNHRIQKFTPDGSFITTVGRHGNGRHQFVYPLSICFNKINNLLYVCDQGNHRIQVLTTQLLFVRSIGSPGEGNGKLNYPKNCAFDSSNNLYVADSGNNCVQVFTSEGESLHSFTNFDSLEKPFAIAIDGKDNVYVSERDQDHLKIFNVRGDHVSSFGVRGSKEGQFREIRGICFNGSNSTLVVSDFSNNRIQIFVV